MKIEKVPTSIIDVNFKYILFIIIQLLGNPLVSPLFILYYFDVSEKKLNRG